MRILGRFLERHWTAAVLSGAGISALLISPAVYKLGLTIEQNLLHGEIQVIKDGLDKDVDYSLARARMLAGSESLYSFIKNGEVENVLTILADERAKGHDNLGFVAVNRDGVVLSRVAVIINRGDYVFQTTPWGRLAAEGQESAMIGAGRAYPLITSGSVPIIKNDKVEGAIFAGFRFDDDYVERFKKLYLPNNTELIFYSRQEGMLGSSFANAPLLKTISQHFSAGSDWVIAGKSNEVVKIGSQYYFLTNIVFSALPGESDSPGGLVVLSPFCLDCQNLAVFSLGGVLFLLALVYIHHKHREPANLRQNLWIVFASGTGVAVFVMLLFWGTTRLYYHVKNIGEPTYTIYNTTLAFDPQSNVVDLGGPQQIAIKVSTSGEAINTIKAVVEYDPEAVKVRDIVMTNSICDEQLVVEKTINNLKGQAILSCGLPSPGFAGARGTVAELLVQPARVGEFTLRFGGRTQVLASDGLGTNVLRQVTNGSYRAFTVLSGTQQMIAPFSTTHPNSERWYKNRTVRFSWPALSGMQYLYEFDERSATISLGEKFTAENMLELNATKDGIYYFHLAARDREGNIGQISHYQIKIDASPREKTLIQASSGRVRPGEVVRFLFSGQDAGSGLQRNFYIKIDNSEFLPTLPDLFVPFFQRGSHIVTLRVFDNAGNYRDETVQIIVK